MRQKKPPEAFLPKEFSYFEVDDLIRLGNKFDGGYLARMSDVISSSRLLSFGINTDWTFEKDFVRFSKKGVDGYDASTNLILFCYQSFYLLFKIKPLQAFAKLISYFSFKTFFVGNKRFIRKFVGDFKSESFISLKSIFDEIKENKLFLKMDIEGSEYRCLDYLIKFQDKFSSVIIEFHDFDCNLEKIKLFLNKFKLDIAHIHINNYTPLTDKNLPQTIEVTFTSQKISSNIKPKLPHALDAPNNSNLNDYKICFKKII